jgi:hypothetical protein
MPSGSFARGLRNRVPVMVLYSVTLLATSLAGRDAAAAISQCGDCYCITWTYSGGAIIEVRCPADSGSPSGWQIGTNPPDGSSGSWDGNGTRKDPPDTLPGMPLAGTNKQLADQAKSNAIVKLKGDKVEDMKGQYEPNACTALFDNAPLSMSGLEMVSTYISFRDGTGVRDAAGDVPCNTAAAWTLCCEHDPVVFICPAQFNLLSSRARTAVIIHEAMHVAGQMEDRNGTVGPGDPPSSGQIDANVKAACGLQ